MLRVASLSLVTLVVMGMSWQLASMAAAQRTPADVFARVEPAARGMPVAERIGADASRARQTLASNLSMALH